MPTGVKRACRPRSQSSFLPILRGGTAPWRLFWPVCKGFCTHSSKIAVEEGLLAEEGRGLDGRAVGADSPRPATAPPHAAWGLSRS